MPVLRLRIGLLSEGDHTKKFGKDLLFDGEFECLLLSHIFEQEEPLLELCINESANVVGCQLFVEPRSDLLLRASDALLHQAICGECCSLGVRNL